MMTDAGLITEKINEVRAEMKTTGIWNNHTPCWVNEFEKIKIATLEDFSEWLQFIYLPNQKTETVWKKGGHERDYIAPQATKFFGSDIKKGRLLQLLIELDSLS